MKQSSLAKQSGDIAKESLSAHRWLGLLVSAFMYLICLTGTLLVFDQEFERWEQPSVDERLNVTPELAARAYHNFIQRYDAETGHHHLVFPGIGIPRLVVEDDHVAHFVESDGSLGEIESAPWTKMLIDLHYYLHLPKTFGMIVVSTLGAILCALIVSGLLAHPRIVKDAFRFRRGGTGMQENIDLHNRLSVWATPFHLVIGITGAYFGLASIFIVVIATAFEDGDTEAAVAKIFEPEPQLEQVIQIANVKKALEDIKLRDPHGKLLFLTVHEPNTPKQFIELYVQQPQRLIYSENYRYDSKGNFIQKGGYSDGETGKQFVYSIYRAHFGDFAGLTSKLLYFVLGMMLTIVSATGINIWLHKRKTKDIVNLLWPAFVWLTPSALVLSAILQISRDAWVYQSFWGALALGLIICCKNYQDEDKLRKHLKFLLCLCLVVLVCIHTIQHFDSVGALAMWQVNLVLILCAGVVGFSGLRRVLKP
ncbi:PepSY domain-containing protein [Glaciecola sp. MH2013]|uniref:PepSY-associated TM helix domain-containing protein n=1 Tax=Glaciecola sp. MH2013 TaxID=2785524 RepID=UPI0018A02F32|nr:PepSY-associated TM helix domain-containing protein [Glaciecola sp. MH2013]MBF7073594.1 PepSY domain-containing protein [Glaciecola sp. MH2013]